MEKALDRMDTEEKRAILTGSRAMLREELGVAPTPGRVMA